MNLQARLQQQLSKSIPAGLPPTFSAQVAPAAPAPFGQTTAANTVGASTDGALPAVRVTSAATHEGLPDRSARSLPSDRLLPVSENELKPVQQQIGEEARVAQLAAGCEPASDVLDNQSMLATSVVGVKRPRQNGPGQASLERVCILTCLHAACMEHA